jgi:hypothetical protein
VGYCRLSVFVSEQGADVPMGPILAERPEHEVAFVRVLELDGLALPSPESHGHTKGRGPGDPRNPGPSRREIEIPGAVQSFAGIG